MVGCAAEFEALSTPDSVCLTDLGTWDWLKLPVKSVQGTILRSNRLELATLRALTTVGGICLRFLKQVGQHSLICS